VLNLAQYKLFHTYLTIYHIIALYDCSEKQHFDFYYFITFQFFMKMEYSQTIARHRQKTHRKSLLILSLFLGILLEVFMPNEVKANLIANSKDSDVVAIRGRAMPCPYQKTEILFYHAGARFSLVLASKKRPLERKKLPVFRHS
jgi:hypothetical protein